MGTQRQTYNTDHRLSSDRKMKFSSILLMSAICSVSLAAADQTPDDPDAAYRMVAMKIPIRHLADTALPPRLCWRPYPEGMRLVRCYGYSLSKPAPDLYTKECEELKKKMQKELEQQELEYKDVLEKQRKRLAKLKGA